MTLIIPTDELLTQVDDSELSKFSYLLHFHLLCNCS